jgi:hypothetical protein
MAAATLTRYSTGQVRESAIPFIACATAKFFITPHYAGYPGFLVRLSQVDLDELTGIVTESWRLCAPKRLLAAYDAGHPPEP